MPPGRGNPRLSLVYLRCESPSDTEGSWAVVVVCVWVGYSVSLFQNPATVDPGLHTKCGLVLVGPGYGSSLG